jgi:hypothetical protein
MPQRPLIGPRLGRSRSADADFRRQYDDLERRRSALAARLKGLGRKAPAHPGYKRALSLINDIFRKCPVAKRRAVLDAADWLIGLLEQLAAQGQPTPNLAARKIRRVLPPDAKPAPAPSMRRSIRRVP